MSLRRPHHPCRAQAPARLLPSLPRLSAILRVSTTMSRHQGQRRRSPSFYMKCSRLGQGRVVLMRVPARTTLTQAVMPPPPWREGTESHVNSSCSTEPSRSLSLSVSTSLSDGCPGTHASRTCATRRQTRRIYTRSPLIHGSPWWRRRGQFVGLLSGVLVRKLRSSALPRVSVHFSGRQKTLWSDQAVFCREKREGGGGSRAGRERRNHGGHREGRGGTRARGWWQARGKNHPPKNRY